MIGVDEVPGGRITVGSAPDSWGVWHAEDPRQPPWEKFLDEMTLAGYRWLELGPHGYLPTDAGRLGDELGRRGLRVSGGDLAGALHREGGYAQAHAAGREVARLTGALGARHVVFLPEMIGPRVGRRATDPEDWDRLTRGVTTLGRALSEEFGVELVFHPHADSHVETVEEIERFLADTDPAHVGLCLDVGHVRYGGGDAIGLVRRHPDRVRYVHLKQVDEGVLETVRVKGWSFPRAVQAGVCVEPPGGSPELSTVLTALRELGRDLFAIVEQDLFPCAPDVPLPIARRTRVHLAALDVSFDTGPAPYRR